jgi:hypothetical protein
MQSPTKSARQFKGGLAGVLRHLSGGAAMTGDRLTFADLIADARHVITALDTPTMQDGAKATYAAIRDGKRLYSQFLDYRGTVRMNKEENCLLQTGLELLRARLRFFGESV